MSKIVLKTSWVLDEDNAVEVDKQVWKEVPEYNAQYYVGEKNRIQIALKSEADIEQIRLNMILDSLHVNGKPLKPIPTYVTDSDDFQPRDLEHSFTWSK